MCMLCVQMSLPFCCMSWIAVFLPLPPPPRLPLTPLPIPHLSQVMAVAGMTSEGQAASDHPSGGRLWLTPPTSPHRVRSSLHTPSPQRPTAAHSSHVLPTSDSASGGGLVVVKEPLALRHSTGEIGTLRDPSAAFFKSLTKAKVQCQSSLPNDPSPEDIAGSAESLVAQVEYTPSFPTVLNPLSLVT